MVSQSRCARSLRTAGAYQLSPNRDEQQKAGLGPQLLSSALFDEVDRGLDVGSPGKVAHLLGIDILPGPILADRVRRHAGMPSVEHKPRIGPAEEWQPARRRTWTSRGPKAP